MKAVTDINDRIAKCQALLTQDPNSQIFAALADACRKKGDLDKAFRICQAGLKIHPRYGSAHVVMAKINLDRGLYDWAEAEVKKAIELDNHSRATDLLTAEIHIYKGEFNQAVTLLRRLQTSDPDDKHIAKLLEIALRLPEEQKALTGVRSDSEDTEHPSGTAAEVEGNDSRAQAIGTRDVVRQAVKSANLQGVLYVTSEGLVAESEWKCRLDADTSAAANTELLRVLDQDLVRALFGRSETVLIETGKWVFYLVPKDGGFFLFVGSAGTSLGGLKMTISSLLARCQEH